MKFKHDVGQDGPTTKYALSCEDMEVFVWEKATIIFFYFDNIFLIICNDGEFEVL